MQVHRKSFVSDNINLNSDFNNETTSINIPYDEVTSIPRDAELLSHQENALLLVPSGITTQHILVPPSEIYNLNSLVINDEEKDGQIQFSEEYDNDLYPHSSSETSTLLGNSSHTSSYNSYHAEDLDAHSTHNNNYNEKDNHFKKNPNSFLFNEHAKTAHSSRHGHIHGPCSGHMEKHNKTWNLKPYRSLLSRPLKLGELASTALCANDCVGSILYMAGQTIAVSGCLAPIPVLIVVAVCYMFRSIYTEAITALPLNGGAYNVLLNTTKKSTACVAAVLTILSYISTAVVSSAEAIHYLDHILDLPLVLISPLIVGLLFLFACLVFYGIGESSKVATGIFLIHILTLSLLLSLSFAHMLTHGVGQFMVNLKTQMLRRDQGIDYGVAKAILFGSSAAMLGISGFETSSNYVEEQKPGVFPKTLRNMWVLCSIFNFTLVSATVSLVNIHDVLEKGTEATIIAELAYIVGGKTMQQLLCLDAFLVLSGGVLTSYVGVTGLVRRLAMDRCLPASLLDINSWRKTNHNIIFAFFFLCTSMYVILDGNVTSLAQTYSVSFLAVMALVAIGLMLLKVKRDTLLPSLITERTTWTHVIFGLISITVALTAAILHNTRVAAVFLLYFSVAACVIGTMLFRYKILIVLDLAISVLPANLSLSCRPYLQTSMHHIIDIPIAVFTKNGNVEVLNKCILYIKANEDCNWVRIIHCFDDENQIPPNILHDVEVLAQLYPKIKIDLVLVKGSFSPAIVAYISVKLNIPRNLMFITAPQKDFIYKLDDLGGVRLVTH